jgi:hypothetical protein
LPTTVFLLSARGYQKVITVTTLTYRRSSLQLVSAQQVGDSSKNPPKSKLDDSGAKLHNPIKKLKI